MVVWKCYSVEMSGDLVVWWWEVGGRKCGGLVVC